MTDTTTCKLCGREGLVWRRVQMAYGSIAPRLFFAGTDTMHDCTGRGAIGVKGVCAEPKPIRYEEVAE